MKTIIFAGLMMDTNLGEAIYPVTLKYLLEKVTGETYQVKNMDLYGRMLCCEDNSTLEQTEKLKYSVNLNLVTKFMIRSVRFTGRKLNKRPQARHAEWKLNPNAEKRLRKYYTETMQGASLVLFAGGGIIECSSNHDYFHHIELITRIAEEMQIPVCFNGVGMVFDPNATLGWDIMKEALNRECVKYFTCRDNQKWINKHLFDGRQFASTVPCSVILSNQGFHTEKEKNAEIIGVGVIRGNIFTSYHHDFDEEQLLNLYADLIHKLKAKGCSCRLFTNGYSKDILFAEKLMQRIGDDSLALDKPEGAEALVKLIAGYRGIITARLHSAIVAYALDVPAVAIAWQKKVSDFMKLIGTPDSAVPLEKLNADTMISQFESLEQSGYQQETRQKLNDRLFSEAKKIAGFIK